MVFDWEDNNVWISQSSDCYNETAMIELTSGPTGLPTGMELGGKCPRPDLKMVWDFGP